ncbi:MAG: tetratricopeptide repeat protein [Bacteroidales bacterium]|nr:tetratricopeptide repeat protein [Bacteroidales bacterium]
MENQIKYFFLLLIFTQLISLYISAQDINNYNEKGLSAYSSGNYLEALDYFNVLISLNPDVAESYSNRGLTYKSLGNYNKAIADFNKAIALNHSLESAYVNRSTVFILLKKYLNAIEDCNIAIKLNSQSYVAFNNRATANSYLGNYEEAIIDFETTLQIDSTYAMAHYSLASVYILMGDLISACKYLHNANNLGYNEAKKLIDFYCSEDYLLHEANKYYSENNYKLCITNLSQYINKNPNSLEAYSLRSLSYLKLYDFDNAKKDVLTILKIQPNSSEGYFLLGSIENLQGANLESINHYNFGLSLDSLNSQGYLGRGMVKYDMGNLKEAILDFDKAIFLDTNNAEAYYYRGSANYYTTNVFIGCLDMKKSIELGLQVNDSFNELDCQTIINQNRLKNSNNESNNDRGLGVSTKNKSKY